MSEMTLLSGHRTRNSNPAGLRPSTLPLGHGVLRVDGKETFVHLTNRRNRETNPELRRAHSTVITCGLKRRI